MAAVLRPPDASPPADRHHDVGRVAVVFGRGEAAVEVYRRGDRQFVAVPDDRAATAARLDRGTRHDALVAPHLRLEVREHLGLPHPLRDLVIVGGGVRAARLQDRRDRQRNGERLRQGDRAPKHRPRAAFGADVPASLGYGAATGDAQRQKQSRSPEEAEPQEFTARIPH